MPGKLGLGEQELELHPAEGHTPDGMAMFAPWLGVLCVGDYLSDVEIPWIHEFGSVDDYRSTLARLAPLVERADVVVPGHGSPHTRERALRMLDEDADYLDALERGDERPRLPAGRDTRRQRVVGQAIEAAGDGDRVIFVDSGSSDGSADTAASLGVEVVSAPVGKGRAVAAALEHCDGGAICLVDADIEASESNIPAALAARYAEGDADMVVAAFDWRERGPLVMTRAVYQPLVEAMFLRGGGRADSQDPRRALLGAAARQARHRRRAGGDRARPRGGPRPARAGLPARLGALGGDGHGRGPAPRSARPSGQGGLAAPPGDPQRAAAPGCCHAGRS